MLDDVHGQQLHDDVRAELMKTKTMTKKGRKFDAYKRMLTFTLARLKLHDPDWDDVQYFVYKQMNNAGVYMDPASVERVLHSEHKPTTGSGADK